MTGNTHYRLTQAYMQERRRKFNLLTVTRKHVLHDLLQCSAVCRVFVPALISDEEENAKNSHLELYFKLYTVSHKSYRVLLSL